MLIASALLLTAAFAQEPAPTRPAAVVAEATAPGHIEAGIAAFKRRRFAEAVSHFQAAVDADPQSAAAHYYLGYAIYKTVEPKRPFHPDKQRAAAEFARAYELDPAFKPSW